MRGTTKTPAAVLLDTVARLGDDGGCVDSAACSTAVLGRGRNRAQEEGKKLWRGEWRRRAPGRLQAREGGTGRPGRPPTATCRPWLARWHSTEQLGGAGRGRRPRCPCGPAGLGGPSSPGRQVRIFFFSI